MSADTGSWIAITEAVSTVARELQCSEREARRKISNHLLDRDFRIAVDRMVTQLPTAEYASDVLLGRISPLPFPPMERIVEERIQLTPLMLPAGALEPDSPLWSGEASFALPEAGEAARASYYGVMVRRSDLSAFVIPQDPRGPVIESPPINRKKPGPAADADWPAAIETVTRACVSAGYSRPLKRGDKNAIITMLLEEMSDRGKHFSDDAARKYSQDVIDKLPDNSTA